MGHKVIKLCPPKEKAGQREAKEAVRSADGLFICENTSEEQALPESGRGSRRERRPPRREGWRAASLSSGGYPRRLFWTWRTVRSSPSTVNFTSRGPNSRP